ncbi:NAD(P)H-dependent oxidoreductase [Carboxylicivirga sediminis]|uniref:NAD(P)H-dependent oxidoreductase n=1 Tax=Carboxylicivirga sediminis TaxID=2006564 RepID=A0A941F264_9BACT|nr:NAD(P)H-dependent oxidoreductase [Carboxylicivirga sediminis]MBR8535361.1 NAD(P)H-dependent oxidoreductase [Carboxylicivirga sediminis]
MKKILIIYAHPIEHKSRINRQLINAVEGIEHVTVNNLYEKYPDFFIDVKYEQELLLEHDIIIWHHPFYWYSAPALLKEWFDLVLEHGFAYGREGKALKGKWTMNCITTGGQQETYQSDGLNRHDIKQFLLPYEQSAYLCRMKYLSPFVVFGSHLLNESEIDKKVLTYTKLIIGLRDDEFTISTLQSRKIVNELLQEQK